jgi:uncharacterized membrane protein
MHGMGNIGWMYITTLLGFITISVVLFIYYSLRKERKTKILLSEPQGGDDADSGEKHEGLKRFNQWAHLVPNIIHLILAILFGVLALHLLHFAVGNLLNSFKDIEEPVSEILNAIWLATVALAVLDLAIIIYDEVSWRGKERDLEEFKRAFAKFLIVVITALAIESLVIFFKVARKEITLLIYPAFALLAICALIAVLAYYAKVSHECRPEAAGDDALQILRIRYARGEIDLAEFKSRIAEIQLTCGAIESRTVIAQKD